MTQEYFLGQTRPEYVSQVGDPYEPTPAYHVNNSYVQFGNTPTDELLDPRRPRTVVGKLFDYLSRPLYSVTEFTDAVLDPNHDGGNMHIFQAMKTAGKAFLDGGQRLSFRDIIEQHNPTFAQEHRLATSVFGFAADVVVDPINLIGIGPAWKTISSSGKAFTLVKNKKLMSVLDETKHYVQKAGMADNDVGALDLAAKSLHDLVEAGPELGIKGLRDTANAQAPKFLSRAQRTGLRSRVMNADVEELHRLGFTSATVEDDVASVFLREHKDIVAKRQDEMGRLVPKDNKYNGRRTEFGKELDKRYDAGLDEFAQKAGDLKRVDPTIDKFADLNLENGVFVSEKFNRQGVETLDFFMGRKTVKEGGQGGVRAAMRFRVDAGGVLALTDIYGDMKGLKTIMATAIGDHGEAVWKAIDKAPLAADDLDRMQEIALATAIELNAPIRPQAIRGHWAKGKIKRKAITTELAKQKERTEGLNAIRNNILDTMERLEWKPEEVLQVAKRGLGIGTNRVGFEQLGKFTGLSRAAEAIGSIPGTKELRAWMGDVRDTVVKPFSKRRTIEGDLENIRTKVPGFKDAGRKKKTREVFYEGVQKQVNSMEAAVLDGKRAMVAAMNDVAELSQKLGLSSEEAQKRVGRMAGAAELHLKALATAHKVDTKALSTQDIATALQAVTKMYNASPQEQALLGEVFDQLAKHNALSTEADLLKVAIRAEAVVPGFTENPLRYMRAKAQRVRHIGNANKKRTDAQLAQITHAMGEDDWFDKIESVEALEALGLNLETHVNALLGTRVLQAKREKQAGYLKGWLARTLGVDEKKLQSLAPNIHKDLSNLGIYHTPFARDEQAEGLLKIYDSTVGSFKKAAVILNPAFAFRQAVGNGIQILAAEGVKMDAGAFTAAVTFMRGKGKGSTYVTPMARIGHEDLTKLMQKYSILRNTSMADTGTEIVTQWGGARFVEEQASRLAFQARVGKESMTNRLMNNPALQYQSWPAMVEDSMRLGSFISLLGRGHTADEAAQLVDKALFNYTSGLTNVERQVMKRVVPFYQFQRFGAELAVDVLKAPAVPQAMHKAWDAFSDTIEKWDRGEALTDTERKIIPGYLLEQPTLFSGWTEDMRAKYWAFHGFNFYESLNLAAFDEKGDFDLPKSLRQGFIASLTPMVKVPLEAAAEMDFFTQRNLNIGGSPADKRNMGELDARAFKAALSQEIVGTLSGGNVVGAGMAAFASWVANTSGGAEGVAQAMLGWEEGIDPETGRSQVYVSPARMAFFATAFPQLRRALNASEQDRTGAQRTMRLLTGARSNDINLFDAYLQRHKEAKRDATAAQNDIYQLMNERRMDSLEAARKDLEEAVKLQMEMGQLTETAYLIRGQEGGASIRGITPGVGPR